MQEKRKLVPVKANWEAGRYEINIDATAQSTLIATTIVQLADGLEKSLKIIFESVAECRYFNDSYGESNYNENLILSPEGIFLEDNAAAWYPYRDVFKETGISPDSKFYEVQNTNWLNERWYQRLDNKGYKHFLLVGYDSYLEVLAKDTIKYEFEDVNLRRIKHLNLAEAMNTYNIALYTIKNKGFDIESELSDDKEEIIGWVAKKDGVSISANSPLSLLALVDIAERYGDNWNKIDTGGLYDKLLEQD
jgi:hypothetical protein